MVAGYGIFGDNEGSGGRDFGNFDNFEAPDPRFAKYESGRCKKKNAIARSAACPKCGSTFLTLSQREGVSLCIKDAKTLPSVDSLLMEEEPEEPQKTHFTKSRCVPCGTEWVAIDMEFLATDVEPLPTGLADDGTLVLHVHNGATAFVEYEEDEKAVDSDDSDDDEKEVDAVEVTAVKAVNRDTYIVQAIVYLPANNVEGTITKVEKNKDNEKDAEVAIDVDLVRASDAEPTVHTKKKAARNSCFGCAMC